MFQTNKVNSVKLKLMKDSIGKLNLALQSLLRTSIEKVQSFVKLLTAYE